MHLRVDLLPDPLVKPQIGVLLPPLEVLNFFDKFVAAKVLSLQLIQSVMKGASFDLANPVARG